MNNHYLSQTVSDSRESDKALSSTQGPSKTFLAWLLYAFPRIERVKRSNTLYFKPWQKIVC